ncbi:rod-binding protein [Mesorhizobium sp. VNQ89]|uniref:rod-binding protein n=1 Tax=Mesorhizobium quangtriensis TaxID=3157709 RepID=UPI0032B85894
MVPIAPPSHIGLDLTRAPSLSEIAAARTDLLRNTGDASAPQFSIDTTPVATTDEAPGTASPESFKRFEAMVLQTFIQNMLPKDGAAVYGKGMAGDMWKSLLAEKIADTMSERGGIGIADRMLGQHYTQSAAGQTETAPAETIDRSTTKRG